MSSGKLPKLPNTSRIVIPMASVVRGALTIWSSLSSIIRMDAQVIRGPTTLTVFRCGSEI